MYILCRVRGLPLAAEGDDDVVVAGPLLAILTCFSDSSPDKASNACVIPKCYAVGTASSGQQAFIHGGHLCVEHNALRWSWSILTWLEWVGTVSA